MTKIIYFTAAAKPTTTEQGHIDTLAGYPGIELAVRNAALVGNTDETPEEADYVANATGSGFPTGYTDTEDYPITSAAAAGSLGLPGTQMLLKSGVEFLSPAPTGSRTDGYTPTIADHAISAIVGS